MFVALLLLISSGAGHQVPASTPQPDPKLIRVLVQTGEVGDPIEVEARRDSVKHLSLAVTGKNKAGVVLVSSESDADVIVNVESRSTTVPKVVIGLSGGMSSPNGRPGPAPTPVKVVKLDATIGIARERDTTRLANKNRPKENESGWKSAADDVANQVNKWIADHRAAILQARRRPGAAPISGS
ncbi:MAG: hypothetical protein ABIP90_09075 [Vicinamibacterales bacterium]